MHKKASFWKPFGRELAKESQKLLKSAEKYFYPNFSALWDLRFWDFRSEILGRLDNTLSANYVYSRSNKENLPLPIEIKLSEKP